MPPPKRSSNGGSRAWCADASAAAAACAVLDELTEGGVLEEAAEIGRYLSDGLQAIAERLGPEKVVEARGSGHLQALELKGKAGPVIDRCREHGVLVISAGENVLRLAPPLTLTQEEAQKGLSVIEKAVSES